MSQVIQLEVDTIDEITVYFNSLMKGSRDLSISFCVREQTVMPGTPNYVAGHIQGNFPHARVYEVNSRLVVEI